MANVQFDENLSSFTSRKILGEPVIPETTKILLKTGFIKNANQAKYTLIGIIIVCLLLTGFIVYWNFVGTKTEALLPKNPTAEEIRTLMENPQSLRK